MRTLVVSMVWLVTGVACSGPTSSGEQRQLAVIGYYHNDDPRITLRDTVEIGESVVLRVNSYGDGCTRKGETQIRATVEGLVVTPYDYVDLSRSSCDRMLHTFSHEAHLAFEDEGEVHVSVVGRDGATGASLFTGRTVVVR